MQKITIEKQTVENYPYGRLRSTAFFGVEFNRKKGFRTTFQTINPKTGRLNAVKNGTYSDLIVMVNDNGFVSNMHFSFNGVKEMNKACAFIGENFELFTPEQIEYFYIQMLVYSKVSIQAACAYAGSTLEALKPIFDGFIKLAVQGTKDKLNHFSAMQIDYEAYEATKDPNFEPFKITSSFVIGS